MIDTDNQKVGTWMIVVGIPSTLPEGSEDNDVPTFWLLL